MRSASYIDERHELDENAIVGPPDAGATCELRGRRRGIDLLHTSCAYWLLDVVYAVRDFV